jgi:hypothetical protein
MVLHEYNLQQIKMYYTSMLFVIILLSIANIDKKNKFTI